MIEAMTGKRMICNQNIGKTTRRRKSGSISYAMTLPVAALLLISVGKSGAAQPSVPQAASQDASVQKLAGQWQLNKDQSDDPRQKMKEARDDSGSGPADGNGNGGGRHQGGHNGEGREQGGGMMAELSVLQIEQTGSNVKITGKTGRTLAQYPPGDQSDAKSAGGQGRDQRTSVSQWQNGLLTVESDGPRGKSTRTYGLSPDGRQLFVTTKMENERFKQPVIYKMVYDFATSKAGGN